jgi:hypothetical protein
MPGTLRLRQRGGARRDRTADLVIANDALSQLSYGPFASRLMQERRSAIGAIYNPHQGQVKNSEIAAFRGLWQELPLFGRGGTDI